MTKEASVNSDVGLDRLVAVSESVAQSASLCRIHARTQAQADGAVARVASAFEISETPVNKPPLVVEIL